MKEIPWMFAHWESDNQFKDFSKRLLLNHHSVPLGKRGVCAVRSPQSNRTSNASLCKTVTSVSSIKALQNCYNFTSLSAYSQHEIKPKSCSQLIWRQCIVFHCNLRIYYMGTLLWYKQKKIHSPSFQVNAHESIFHSLNKPLQIFTT